MMSHSRRDRDDASRSIQRQQFGRKFSHEYAPKASGNSEFKLITVERDVVMRAFGENPNLHLQLARCCGMNIACVTDDRWTISLAANRYQHVANKACQLWNIPVRVRLYNSGLLWIARVCVR
jgi:hypothetical protein